MIRFWAVILFILFSLLLSGNLVSLYTDWLWFQEIGQLPVFLTTLSAQLKMGMASGLLFFFVLCLSLIGAHRYRKAGGNGRNNGSTCLSAHSLTLKSPS